MFKNIKWGISFNSLDNIRNLPRQLPECLSILELPGIMLEPLEQGKINPDYPNITELYFSDLLDSAVSREIISQNESIQDDFKELLRKLIAEAASLKSSGIFADFAIENSFNDMFEGDKVKNFIKSMAHALYNFEQRLLFPVRIPLIESVTSPEQYLEFIKKLMIPQAAFSLDIHPHELAGKDFSPETILKWLQFDTIMLRFIYEPETGNRLVKKSITPWIEHSEKHTKQLKIVFAPVFRQPDTLENEINLFEQLISNLNNS